MKLKASADQLCVVGVQPLYELLIVSAAAALLLWQQITITLKCSLRRQTNTRRRPAELYSQCHFLIPHFLPQNESDRGQSPPVTPPADNKSI